MNYKRIKLFSLLLIFFYSSVQPSEYYGFVKRYWKEISFLGGAAYLIWKIYPSKSSSQNQQQDNEDSSGSSSSMQSNPDSGEQKQRREIYVPNCNGFKYGIESIQNDKETQEDRFQVAKISDKIAYFGVFDGHGGWVTSEFLKEDLHFYFKGSDLSEDSIDNAFRRANDTCCRLKYPDDKGILPCEIEGSTALVAFVDSEKQKLIVANAGDCRAVICKNGKAIALSNDHKASNENEKKRVQEAGGSIISYGCYRVFGPTYSLAVTRSFGDKLIKGLICDPEIEDCDLDKDCEFLILASDGLWDRLSNDEAVKHVKNIFNEGKADRCQKAASVLTRLALRLGSRDNITVIVIDLQNEAPTA